MVDLVAEREKQRQIEEDIRRIKAQQQQESLRRISAGQPLTGRVSSSSKRRISFTPEETKKVSILYKGEDRIDIKPGVAVEQAVRKRRAEDVVKRIQVKETLKALGRPEGYTVPVSFMPTKLDIRRTTRQDVEKDITYRDKEFITPGFERRIETQLEREKRLDIFKQAIYERTGLEKTPEQERFKLRLIRQDIFGKSIPVGVTPTKESLIGLGKTVGQFPFELGTLPVYVYGRGKFAVEAMFSEAGRAEASPFIVEQGKLKFGQVVGKTGKAVAQSFDPTTTTGLFNIALTGVAIKSIGKARVKARQKPSFITEELVTKRVTSKDFTIDKGYVDVEAVLGKKRVSLKGRATQTYEKLPSGEYAVKGLGELTELGTKKVTKIKTDGRAIDKGGGFDATSISEVVSGKKTTHYLDQTLTAELVKEPTQVFKSISRTQKVKIGTAKGTEIVFEPTSKISKLTPYEYSKRLKAEGKLDIGWGELPEKVGGTYNIDTKKIKVSDFYQEPKSFKRSKLIEKDFQRIVAHEVTHAQTPFIKQLAEFEIMRDIPSKYRPSEIIARAGEKRPFFGKTAQGKFIERPYDIKYIKEVKPARLTAGTTGEIYVETLFGKPGESMFRKTVKTEIGRPIAIEQVMASDRFGISAKQFETQFEGITRQRDISRTLAERKGARPITIDTGTGSIVTKQVLQVEGMPQVTGQVLQQVAKGEALTSIGKVKTAQVVKSASVGGVSVSGLSFPGLQKATIKTSTVNLPKVDSATVTKAGLDSSQVVDVLPKLQDKSAVRLRSRTISKVDTKTQPMVKTKPLTELKPMQQVKPYLEVKPAISTKLEVASKQAVRTQPAFRPRPSFRPSPSFTPQPVPPSSSFFIPPPPPIAGQMYLPDSTGKPVKTKAKIKTQYTPSVEALVFDIRASKFTKNIKIQAKTGLGLRPIKL